MKKNNKNKEQEGVEEAKARENSQRSVGGPGSGMCPGEARSEVRRCCAPRGSRGGLVNESTCPLLKRVAALLVWSTFSACVCYYLSLLLLLLLHPPLLLHYLLLYSSRADDNKGTVYDQREVPASGVAEETRP